MEDGRLVCKEDYETAKQNGKQHGPRMNSSSALRAVPVSQCPSYPALRMQPILKLLREL